MQRCTHRSLTEIPLTECDEPVACSADDCERLSRRHWLTDGGRQLRLAQYLFAALYLAFQTVVFAIYYKTNAVLPLPHPADAVAVRVTQCDAGRRCRRGCGRRCVCRRGCTRSSCCDSSTIAGPCSSSTLPSGSLPPNAGRSAACCSRTSSLASSKLCLAPFFGKGEAELVPCLIVAHVGSLGCSVATSIKMNILNFAPALLLLLLKTFGPVATVPRLAICALFQVRARTSGAAATVDESADDR
jgi:hypothetical protein